ncbi:MAG: transcriptional repressor [Dictyoglomus sp.]|nr:transcriptional repressor [Dictyoglomus sp.]MCX7941718.1 transcriptional repressor [Dictyoglomaceae bacterium]MDW8189060.1 transcriptional repressor [Dictyoglomus sp.]
MYRETKQRKVIEEIVKNTKEHPDALWVFQKAQEKASKISLGTVYRALELLVREGKINKFYDANAVARFDGDPSPHHHLICKNCGKIIDWYEEDLNKKIEEIGKSNNFKELSYKVFIYGTCPDCQRK